MLRIRIRVPVPFDPCIEDPGWVKSKDLDLGYGSGMCNPDHISESLEETIFCVKISKFFDADPDRKRSYLGSGMENIWIRDGKNSDLGSGMEKIPIRHPGWKKFGSGINIPNPQHW